MRNCFWTSSVDATLDLISIMWMIINSSWMFISWIILLFDTKPSTVRSFSMWHRLVHGPSLWRRGKKRKSILSLVREKHSQMHFASNLRRHWSSKTEDLMLDASLTLLTCWPFRKRFLTPSMWVNFFCGQIHCYFKSASITILFSDCSERQIHCSWH